MNSKSRDAVLDDDSDDFDDEDDDEFGDTTVLSDTIATDNVGDVSVEINVEQLIADVEKSDEMDAARKREIRRRLEELAEKRSFEDTFAMEFDKD
jgi:hypothetical protein